LERAKDSQGTRLVVNSGTIELYVRNIQLVILHIILTSVVRKRRHLGFVTNNGFNVLQR